MTGKSLPATPTLLNIRIRRPCIEEEEGEEEALNQIIETSSSLSREKDLQIVSTSPFTLPDDWFVERRPRPSNHAHIDKYYYEPGTGRKFRSLVSVQRYLTEEKRGSQKTERLISENENTTYFEPRTGQRFRSLRAVERYLNGENACTATPKPCVKCSTGKRPFVKASTREQSTPDLRSCLKALKKRSLVAEEDEISQKELATISTASLKSKHSKKSGSQKKISSEKDNKDSMLNLARPPEKVSWVLSGPGGFWRPFLDDSVVPESVKLKWSEAFVLSIQGGD